MEQLLRGQAKEIERFPNLSKSWIDPLAEHAVYARSRAALRQQQFELPHGPLAELKCSHTHGPAEILVANHVIPVAAWDRDAVVLTRPLPIERSCSDEHEVG